MTEQSKMGILIAIEGIDGAGKTTQARDVETRLRSVGLEVVVTKEPTDGAWGAKLRASAKTGRLEPREEFEYFIADRREHVDTVIRPALDSGKIVIVDRYYYSSLAYQGARGIDEVEILQANNAFAPTPDVVFLLELPVVEALLRINHRDGQENHFERAKPLEEVSKRFSAMADPHIVRLDGRLPERAITQLICTNLYRGVLLKAHCPKGYKTECEPGFCVFQVAQKCRYLEFGQLDPVSSGR